MIIDMLLFCPNCSEQHIDVPDPKTGWDNSPHATHLCKFCKLRWRPSNVNTNGVASLPIIEAKHAAPTAACDPKHWRGKGQRDG